MPTVKAKSHMQKDLSTSTKFEGCASAPSFVARITYKVSSQLSSWLLKGRMIMCMVYKNPRNADSAYHHTR